MKANTVLFLKKKPIVGMGVCGPGEADRYLEATLKEFKRLCDEVVICTNNAGEKEKNLIEQYGFRQYEDNREWGKEQWKIKEELLKNHVALLNPDWILTLDMDEVFEQRVTKEILLELAKIGLAWTFYLVNLWNDEEHYHKGLSFRNVRFFKYAPEYGLHYQKKGVHCGLAPAFFYNFHNDAPYIIRHYGLMNPEDRKRKVSRYEKYDPQAVFKGREYYDTLASDPKPATYQEEKVHQKVAEEIEKRVTKYHTTMPKNKVTQYTYLRHPETGRSIDVPSKDAHRYVKKGWEVVSEVDLNDPPKPKGDGPGPVVLKDKKAREKKEENFTCKTCKREFANQRGLSSHRSRAH